MFKKNLIHRKCNAEENNVLAKKKTYKMDLGTLVAKRKEKTRPKLHRQALLLVPLVKILDFDLLDGQFSMLESYV